MERQELLSQLSEWIALGWIHPDKAHIWLKQVSAYADEHCMTMDTLIEALWEEADLKVDKGAAV
jgi:hypothetical protein